MTSPPRFSSLLEAVLLLLIAALVLRSSHGFRSSSTTTTRSASQQQRGRRQRPSPPLSAVLPSSSDNSEATATTRRQDLKKVLLETANEFEGLQKEIMFASQSKEGNILGAKTFASTQLELGEKGKQVIRYAEQLAKMNPTSEPLLGWKGFGINNNRTSGLEGTWKLRFTSGSDASFPESEARGKTATSQVIDATMGTLINTVDFEKGKLAGFRVVVEGTAFSGTEMDLIFKRIILLRRSRFPRLFGRITIPLPSFRFLSFLGRVGSRGKYKAKGAGFTMQYLDDDLRMHKTNDGIWFIQTRLL